MLDAVLKARDLGLYTAITDCGAGGLSSALGEMGDKLGVRVDLDKVPLKYQGLSYTEIWISESQERMTMSVPKRSLKRLLEVFASENVEATVVGEFTGDKRLRLFYKGNKVCDLDMEFLHKGLPKTEKKAVYSAPKHAEPRLRPKKDLTPVLVRLLGHYDICSKEWVVRQYDHEVQGGTVLKPLVGRDDDGPSDAAIVKPSLDSRRAVVVSNGINFRFGLIDPYWMAASCIDEALRQVIASGGSLSRVALLDNFCWGNPDKPDRLGGLVRCAYGCYDIAKAFGVPFISGKDSMYNEYKVKGKSIAIPGTLLISAIGVMEDASNAVSMYAKQGGDLIYVVGTTYDELGGSHYYDLFEAVGRKVPLVRAHAAKAAFDALSRASAKGLVRAMHDCSDGGLGVACAEMAFAGGLGMECFLSEVPYEPSRPDARRDDFILFSESNSRLVVEVAKEHRVAFERQLAGIPFGVIGCVRGDRELRVHGLDGKICIGAKVEELKRTWKESLRW
jgi:phosphoribosylformylglycinamidine synthase